MSGVSHVNLGKSACWLFVEIRSSVSPPIVYLRVLSVTERGVQVYAWDCGESSGHTIRFQSVSFSVLGRGPHTVGLGLNMGASWFIGSYHFEMFS